MFIKTIKGDYINTDAIAKLRIVSTPPFTEWHVEAMADPYEELATIGEEFRTKEDAEAYLDAMVAFIEGKPVMVNMPAEAAVKSPVPFATALCNALETKLPKGDIALKKRLHKLLDDYELSGDEDYLLKINACLSAYWACK